MCESADLNENGPNVLIYLNKKSKIGECFEKEAFLKEECHLGWAFEF